MEEDDPRYGLNPKEAYPVILSNIARGEDPTLILEDASFYGHIRLVRYILNLGLDLDLNRALGLAVEESHPEIVRLLIQYGANIVDSSPLMWAAANNDFETVQILLETGTDVNMDEGRALIRACSVGNFEMVKYLVESGANIHLEEEGALYEAITHDHLEITRFLIGQGANIGELEIDLGMTLGNPELFLYLLELGVSMDSRILETAAVYGFHDEIDLALDYGARLNDPESRALKLATVNGRLETVRFLLEKGADPDWGAPLAHTNNTEIINLLLQYGADPNIENGAPLLLAVQNNEIEHVFILLAFGADPNLGIAFFQSAFSPDPTIFRFLLTRPINSDLKGRLLDLTIENQNWEIIQSLIYSGLGEPLRPDQKVKLLELSIQNRSLPIIQSLLDLDPHLDLGPGLVAASVACYPEIVQFLLSRGARVDFDNNQSLYLASMSGCIEVVQVLLQYGARDHYGYIARDVQTRGYYQIADLLRSF